jgi:8-oxo-dGTP pyrophosphatase MutT (NUDIX family)
VLALVFRRGSKWHTVLTRRQQRLSAHSGQISLPGGSIEAGESAPTAAARECQEELGLEARHIHVLGPLTPLYVFGSGFLVRPFVGTCPGQPTWVPAEEEVAEVLEVPLVNLVLPQSVVSCARPLGRTAFSAPAIGWGGNRVWGATAMILGELITILRQCDLR